MKRIWAILTFAIGYTLSAQNFVPNPSFETYAGCPAGNSAISNGFVTSWNRPPGSIITPDLFTPCTSSGSSCSDFNTASNCVGSSTAFHGTAYAGFLWYYTGCPNCKEYIVAQLTSTLVNGTVYRASYRTKLGPLCRYGTNRHGLYVSAAAPSQPGGNQPILITPTVQLPSQVLDKINWTLVTGTFTSAGTENYITIGNFYNDASTSIFNFGASAGSCIFATGAAYYYIDSVLVMPPSVLPVQVLNFAGNATPLGNQLIWDIQSDVDLDLVWLEHSTDGNGFAPIAEYREGDLAHASNGYLHTLAPNGPNYYRVGYEDANGNFNVSNTVMIYNSEASSFAEMQIYPNPADRIATLQCSFASVQEGNANLQLFNAEGKLIREQDYSLEGNQFSVELNLADLDAGVYYFRLNSGNSSAQEKLVVVR